MGERWNANGKHTLFHTHIYMLPAAGDPNHLSLMWRKKKAPSWVAADEHWYEQTEEELQSGHTKVKTRDRWEGNVLWWLCTCVWEEKCSQQIFFFPFKCFFFCNYKSSHIQNHLNNIRFTFENTIVQTSQYLKSSLKVLNEISSSNNLIFTFILLFLTHHPTNRNKAVMQK